MLQNVKKLKKKFKIVLKYGEYKNLRTTSESGTH